LRGRSGIGGRTKERLVVTGKRWRRKGGRLAWSVSLRQDPRWIAQIRGFGGRDPRGGRTASLRSMLNVGGCHRTSQKHFQRIAAGRVAWVIYSLYSGASGLKLWLSRGSKEQKRARYVRGEFDSTREMGQKRASRKAGRTKATINTDALRGRAIHEYFRSLQGGERVCKEV